MAKVEQVLSLEPQHELKFRGKRAAGPGAVTQRPAPEGTRPEGRTLSTGDPACTRRLMHACGVSAWSPPESPSRPLPLPRGSQQQPRSPVYTFWVVHTLSVYICV